MASGSHVCSGICADLATAPPSRPSATRSTDEVARPADVHERVEAERSRMHDQQEQGERHRRVAERVHDEGLLRRRDRARPFVVEADQQVRGEADEPPADEQQQQVPAWTSMSIEKTNNAMYAK
jgi:hypothetical protein